jgi:DMSO reductase anchor subunit
METLGKFVDRHPAIALSAVMLFVVVVGVLSGARHLADPERTFLTLGAIGGGAIGVIILIFASARGTRSS